jgi:triosephosphate isomerase (TIM)
MRTPFIAGNWKMNTTVNEARQLVLNLRNTIDGYSGIDKLVCPPFISIPDVYKELQGSSISVGAQNMYSEDKGAFTGEISPVMLKQWCKYVIIGHSERRQYFGENGAMLSKKVQAAIKHEIKPILCVGENLPQYEDGLTKKVVSEQIELSLAGVNDIETLTIAYEPVWAIGTGKAATGLQAEETVTFIRRLIEFRYGSNSASRLRILYGGSVSPANIAEFISQPDIDGALVGGASLKSVDFTDIVRITFEQRLK